MTELSPLMVFYKEYALSGRQMTSTKCIVFAGVAAPNIKSD